MKALFLILTFVLGFNLHAAVVEQVHMKSPWGFNKTYSSNDLDFILTPVEGLPVLLSPYKRDHLLCRDKLTMDLLLEKVEKKNEVASMLISLKDRGELSQVDLKKLKRIPDCKPFRFHLHMIAKALNGYKVKQIK